MSEMQDHSGGCHCGAVRYTATVDLGRVITCNCSRCAKLGWIMTFTPTENFNLVSGEDRLTEYTFNRKEIRHQFCRICGIEPFAIGTPPGGSTPLVAVNIRCLEGVEPTELAPIQYDGKSR